MREGFARPRHFHMYVLLRGNFLTNQLQVVLVAVCGLYWSQALLFNFLDGSFRLGRTYPGKTLLFVKLRDFWARGSA